MEKSKFDVLNEIQKKIDFYGQYHVEPENDYCFRLHTNVDSITRTIIAQIEALGYPFLHVQLRNGELVGRFSYE